MANLKLSVSILGADKVAQRLNQGKQIMDKHMVELLERAAVTVVATAKPTAPAKTGTLRRSIHYEGPFKSGNTVTIIAGTDVFYAPFQEFGTSTGVPAIGYMKAGRDKARQELPKELRNKIGDIARDLRV